MASLNWLPLAHMRKFQYIAKRVVVVPRRMKSQAVCEPPKKVVEPERKKTRPECEPPEMVKCKKAKFVCPGRDKKGVKSKDSYEQFQSMWWNPFCNAAIDPCPQNPRFDDLYYMESDKANRLYWQTWVSCPKVQMKLKKICDFTKIKKPPICRRPPPKIKTTKPCPSAEGCRTVGRECSRQVRCPVKCIHVTDPSDCKKPMAPYPAFSECLRLRPGELPLSECLCYRKPAMCEAWAEYRKRHTKK